MTQQKNPLILMDIDGVLNALAPLYGGVLDFPVTQHRINGYLITMNPLHREWVGAMTATGAELVWATMWQSEAATSFAPVFGHGTDWKHIDFHSHRLNAGEHPTHGSGDGIGGHKWPGILATVGDRPFVWVDDDAQDWQMDWCAKRTESGIPSLIVRPDADTGMSGDDFAQVMDFVELVSLDAALV